MAGTNDTVFELGAQYWCVHPQMEAPLLGTVVALTDAVGKRIGLEFSSDIPGGHSCDGRASHPRGLWVLPEHIYNESEWESVAGVLSAQKAASLAAVGRSYKIITIDPDTGEVITDDSSQGGQATPMKVKSGNFISAEKE